MRPSRCSSRFAIQLSLALSAALSVQACTTKSDDAPTTATAPGEASTPSSAEKTVWVTDGNPLPAAPAGSEWVWTGKNAETMPPKKEYELRPVSGTSAAAEKIWVTDGDPLPEAQAGFEWEWTGNNSETMPPKKEYELRPKAK